MTTRQISFPIQGMRGACAKCAASIERALAGLDGVAVARVNYAAERANVVYDAARVTPGAVVQAVRGEGFDVPLERVTLYADDLLYATSVHMVERVLTRADGVVQVSADLAARQIAIDAIPAVTPRDDLTGALARLGFQAVEAPSSDAWMEFVVRGNMVALIGIILIWGAVNHVPVLSAAGLLPSPILLGIMDALALFGAGFPFFRRAFLASTQREIDWGILLAFIALVAFLWGAAWTLNGDARAERVWLAWSGYIAATLLTAGWFAARGFTAFVFPRIVTRRSVHPWQATALGIVSHGTRH